jgi:uncharacterized protein (DUF1800 family)
MPLAPRFLSRQMLCLLLASPWQWVAAQAPSDGLAARTAAADLSPAATLWRATARFGYAPQPATTDTAQGMAWALAQLAPAQRDSQSPANVPEALSVITMPLPTVFTRFRQAREAQRKVGGAGASADTFIRDMARSAAAWRLAACSQPEVENPLLARLTEFWFNHLNVYSGKGSVRPFTGHYVVNVARKHALGRFEDLLLASARHPAMLHYLDQFQSVAEGSRGANGQTRGLNENYARELMELHTLGADGGYTQTDVRDLARVLTGWTIGPRAADGFRFAPRLHDSGNKVVLGQRFEGSGAAEGEAAIRMLARHPATAQRISLRLAQWFVADQPPPALVQRLAQRYLATQGDIAAVMRTLIESPETWVPEAKLFKTPMDYACSVLAAAGGPQEARDYAQALGFLTSAGQPLHGWQTPDGYKTDAATWLSPEALSRRADLAMAIGRRVPDAQTVLVWLSPATRTRIAQEPERMQAGLALASPDYMAK